MSVESQLLSADGKVIYTDTQELHDFLTPTKSSQLRSRPLAVAGRLVAVPGKYQLKVDVTNLVTKQSFAQTRGVLVPAFDHTLGMSQVVFSPLAPPNATTGQNQPFSFSGVKIPVAGADNADARWRGPNQGHLSTLGAAWFAGVLEGKKSGGFVPDRPAWRGYQEGTDAD